MINFSEELLKRIDSAANAFGLSRSAYVRTVMIEKISQNIKNNS